MFSDEASPHNQHETAELTLYHKKPPSRGYRLVALPEYHCDRGLVHLEDDGQEKALRLFIPSTMDGYATTDSTPKPLHRFKSLWRL